MEDKKEIRVPMYGNGQVSIQGLEKEELEKVMAAMTAGAYYIKVKNGRLEAIPIWEKLPSPIEDDAMLPFWRKAKPEEMAQTELFDEMTMTQERIDSPAISIQSLCGYYYSKEAYKLNAEKLTSYGFECLRSQRGIDAKFWEVWYLSALCTAQGELGDILKIAKDEKKKLEIALEFLRKKISFGSLNISVQKMAQRMPE